LSCVESTERDNARLGGIESVHRATVDGDRALRRNIGDNNIDSGINSQSVAGLRIAWVRLSLGFPSPPMTY
jgi:hypothetical protein